MPRPSEPLSRASLRGPFLFLVFVLAAAALLTVSLLGSVLYQGPGVLASWAATQISAFAMPVAAALGLGWLLTLGDATLKAHSRLVVSAGLGAGLLGQGILCTSLAGFDYRFTWPLVMFAGALLGVLPAGILLWRALSRPAPGGRIPLWALSAAGAWGLFLLVCAATPAVDFDSLVYHLALPAQWRLPGPEEVLPTLHYSYFPLAAEAFFGWLPEIPAKLLSWTFLPLAAGATGLLAWRLLPEEERRWGPSALAAGLFATVPAVAVAATLTYNDLWTTALVLLALEAILRRGESGRVAPALQAGAFAGLAAASKYTALAALPALAVAAGVVLALRPEERTRRAARDAALAAAVGLLVAAPVYLRNVLAVGNPVYPALHGLFGGGLWDAAAQRGLADAYHGARTLWGLLRLPVDLVTNPERFAVGADPGLLLFLGIPAAVLAVMGAGAEGLARRRAAGAAFVLLVLAWWTTAMNGRYLLPALGILGALAASGACRSWEAERSTVQRWVAVVLLGLAMAWGGVAGVRFQVEHLVRPAALQLLGRESPDDYLARRRPIRRFYQRVDAIVLEPQEPVRILLVGESRAYGLRQPTVWGSAYDPAPLAVLARRAEGPEDLRAVLREEGITHVLVNAAEGDRLDRQYGHFRQLGGGAWKKLLAEALPDPPLISDPIHGHYLLDVPGPEARGSMPGK